MARETIAANATGIILVIISSREAIGNNFDAHYELKHRLETQGKEVFLEAGKKKNIIPERVTVTSVRHSEVLCLGRAVFCAEQLPNKEPSVALLPDVLGVIKNCEEKIIASS